MHCWVNLELTGSDFVIGTLTLFVYSVGSLYKLIFNSGVFSNWLTQMALTAGMNWLQVHGTKSTGTLPLSYNSFLVQKQC
jgi:hypothetical protein